LFVPLLSMGAEQVIVGVNIRRLRRSERTAARPKIAQLQAYGRDNREGFPSSLGRKFNRFIVTPQARIGN